jgi:hypothetical protein
MENRKNVPDQRQQQTDKGEDAEDLRRAQQAWKDRQGIPRGTPEQGGRSADQVGGTGTARPEPELDDEDVAPEGGRKATPDETKDPEDERQAGSTDPERDDRTEPSRTPKNV